MVEHSGLDGTLHPEADNGQSRERDISHVLLPGGGKERIEAGNGEISTSPTTAVDMEKTPDEEIPPDAGQSSQLPLSKARTIALVATVTGAALLNTLSVQSSVIVLPTIGRELDIPNASQQWIVSSYSLAFGTFLLLWGRLADVYGKRPIFILGSAWVCIVTLICPFIPSEIGFDTMRGLQGLGAAANVPTAIGILGVTFPPGKAKNYAFAAYSSGAPVSVQADSLDALLLEPCGRSIC